MTGPLIEQAQALASNLSALSKAVEKLDTRSNRNEKITFVAVIGLVLDLILSVIVAIVLSNQVSTAGSLQATIDREAQTRQQALCPVYGLVLGGYNPNSRAAGPDRDAYIQSFKVMTDAYDTLDCAGGLTPGPAR